MAWINYGARLWSLVHCLLSQVQRTGISEATSKAAMAQLNARKRFGRFRRRRNCWPSTVQLVVEMHPMATYVPATQRIAAKSRPVA